jgi:hypothetical protein
MTTSPLLACGCPALFVSDCGHQEGCAVLSAFVVLAWMTASQGDDPRGPGQLPYVTTRRDLDSLAGTYCLAKPYLLLTDEPELTNTAVPDSQAVPDSHQCYCAATVYRYGYGDYRDPDGTPHNCARHLGI